MTYDKRRACCRRSRANGVTASDTYDASNELSSDGHETPTTFDPGRQPQQGGLCDHHGGSAQQRRDVDVYV